MNQLLVAQVRCPVSKISTEHIREAAKDFFSFSDAFRDRSVSVFFGSGDLVRVTDGVDSKCKAFSCPTPNRAAQQRDTEDK